MATQAHQSDAQVLNRRSLERDHRRLADWIQPGFAVLDVGCGTGSISAGIVRVAGPAGAVTGIDRDAALLVAARTAHADGNLRFVRGDATALPFKRHVFDLATTSRTLQWIGDPESAVAEMARVVKPRGVIVALDYNHEATTWIPEPPPPFARFYAAFLAWRVAQGWDNRIGDRLPDLLRDAGLNEIAYFNEDEVTERGCAGFTDRAAIWTHVIDSIGPAIVRAGLLTEAERTSAAVAYAGFVAGGLQVQTLSLRAAAGRIPSGPERHHERNQDGQRQGVAQQRVSEAHEDLIG